MTNKHLIAGDVIDSNNPLPVTSAPGTGPSSLGKAEDAVHASQDVGVLVFAVRKDTAAALAADGDYHVLEVDALGRLRVTAESLVAQGYNSVITLTRTNDTNAYGAGDVIGSAVAGGGAVLTFPNIGPSGGPIMITSATLEIQRSSIPSGMTSFTLKLYSATPPSALGDNAAWDFADVDRGLYLGDVPLGAPADLGANLFVEANGINKQVKLTGSSLFAYLVTAGGYTPAASTVKLIGLNAVAL